MGTSDPKRRQAAALPNPLEISLALFVTAIAIELDCVTRAFTGCAAVFSAFLRRTRARWILAFVFVSHDSSPDDLHLKMSLLGERSLTQSGGSLVRGVAALNRAR
jgi:hypothetical protein